MKSIEISAELFGRIWSMRQEGENTEEAILSRVLADAAQGRKNEGTGLLEPAYGLKFKEGFEVTKDYLGVLYTARAEHGNWHLLNNGKIYRSLNAMTDSVTKSKTNAWHFWEFRDGFGKRRKLSTLRPANKIRRREVKDIQSEIEKSA